MGKKKTNPRSIPRSQADVDRAFDRGQENGINGAYNIMLYVLKDKLKKTDDEVKEFTREFNVVVHCLMTGDIKVSDIKEVLKDEFQLEFVLTDNGSNE